jgi:PTS system mannose-specific IIA component
MIRPGCKNSTRIFSAPNRSMAGGSAGRDARSSTTGRGSDNVADFRIVVAAHGGLASGFLASAELICGPLPNVVPVPLEASDSPESFRERLVAAMGDPAEPLLVLTDLRGGTPHNVACVVVRDYPRAVLVSGINLAILIEAATSLSALDEDAVDRLVAAGRDNLTVVRRLVAEPAP